MSCVICMFRHEEHLDKLSMDLKFYFSTSSLLEKCLCPLSSMISGFASGGSSLSTPLQKIRLKWA